MGALLNQIIAIEKGIKSRVYAEITELHKICKKPELFNGFSKQYQKVDEDDKESLPPESKLVQYNVPDVLSSLSKLMSELMTVTARKDWSNSNATAAIKVNGVVLATEVPVTYLLFLEKQLADIRTFVDALPTLDGADNWFFDDNTALYKTSEIKTHRTKKVQRSLVLLQPTDHHPGQAQLITEDVLVGHWVQIKNSGAMPKPQKVALLTRVDILINAVKEAREFANSIVEVDNTPDVGAAIFEYLLPK